MVWGDEYKCPTPWLAYNEKLKKKHWLKCPKAVTKKKKFGQNINDSKFHIWNSFLKNIISVIQPSYICRDVFFSFQILWQQVLKPTRTCEKYHSF